MNINDFRYIGQVPVTLKGQQKKLKLIKKKKTILATQAVSPLFTKLSPRCIITVDCIIVYNT